MKCVIPTCHCQNDYRYAPRPTAETVVAPEPESGEFPTNTSVEYGEDDEMFYDEAYDDDLGFPDDDGDRDSDSGTVESPDDARVDPSMRVCGGCGELVEADEDDCVDYSPSFGSLDQGAPDGLEFEDYDESESDDESDVIAFSFLAPKGRAVTVKVTVGY
jgi:hypothetical protein